MKKIEVFMNFVDSIYDYNSISHFLKDVYEHKKKNNSSFSIRSWAKKMRIDSSGALSQMINGKRRIPTKLLKSFSEELLLSDKEELYFRRLHELEVIESTSPSSQRNIKSKFFNKLFFKKRVSTNDSLIKKTPVFFVLKTLKSQKHFEVKEMTFKNVRKYLDPAIGDAELNEALNVYKKRENFALLPERLTNQIEQKSKDVQRFHHYFFKIAIEKLFKSPVESKEFNSYSMNIDPEDMHLIKKRIRAFHDEMISEFDKVEGTQTYQLGSYFCELGRLK